MTLFNQGWIGFGGSPITGRVPTRLLIYAEKGQTPNGQQQAGINHAYKLFCDAVTGSAFPGGYHIARRVLPDGTTLEMVSNNHVHEVRAKLPPLRGPEDELLRGFVARPVWETGTFPDEERRPALVWYIDPRGWFIKKQPYRPGGDSSTPTYSVAQRRTSHKVRDREIKSDQKYFDVFTGLEARLYKNGQPYMTVPDIPGVPLLTFTPPPPGHPGEVRTVYQVQGGTVDHLDEPGGAPATWAQVFNVGAHIEVLAAGYTFEAAPAYRADSATLEYTTQNVTTPGALQVWHVEATLEPASPWLNSGATHFEQIGVTSALAVTGPWTETIRAVSGSPIWGVTDPRAMIAYWGYDLPTTSGSSTCTYNGDLVGTTLAPQTGSTENVYTYTHTIPDSGSAELLPGVDCGYTRSVAITSEIILSSVNWNIVNTFGTIYTDSVGSAFGYDYQQAPRQGLGSATVQLGDLIAGALGETSKRVIYSDTATATAYVGSDTIYDAGIDHTLNHLYGQPVDFLVTSTAPATQAFGGFGSGPSMVNAPPRAGLSYPLTNHRVETFDATVTTKDYFFHDPDNNVWAWVELVLTGDLTNTDGTITGSTSFTVKLKIATPYASAEAEVFSESIGEPVLVAVAAPVDINFGTLETTWQHTSPERTHPIFAPLWRIQGACPYIAYTTADELAAPALNIQPRLMASFRLQLSWTGRPPLAPTVDDIPDTVRFYPYMMEQALDNHWPTDRTALWNSIEATMARIDASTPGALLSSIGLPGLGDELHPQYYRT